MSEIKADFPISENEFGISENEFLDIGKSPEFSILENSDFLHGMLAIKVASKEILVGIQGINAGLVFRLILEHEW